MATYRIDASQVARALKAEDARTVSAIKKGAYRAAMRGKGHLVGAAKKKGKVDLGQYINSFQVARRGDGIVVLYNDSPIAGVIELGARPHPVSEEGQFAIREWVRRKLLGVSEELAEQNDEVEAIARAIVEKIRRYGQEPTYIFRDEQAVLSGFVKEEVERARREAERGPGGQGAPA